VEQRRIPEIERLETRDVPSAPAVPYLPSPIHLSALRASPTPPIIVIVPTTPAAASEAQVTRDLLTPAAPGDVGHPLAAVWQQAADVEFCSLTDPVATDWLSQQILQVEPPENGATASQHQAAEAQDAIAATATAPSPQQSAPTIESVQRYAWRSVGRHRLDDPSDAVQEICLEWLQLAAVAVTTYDDLRRIVARVVDRGRRRLEKRNRTLELLDAPARGEGVEESFRDMELDRDLGMRDLTDREWQVVGLRRQGYTFAEIGLRVGLRKQRAREMFEVALSYLRQRYCDQGVLATA
jgi:hypothetical protein